METEVEVEGDANVRAQTVERKWGEMSGAVPQRDAKLQAELARQQENERLRAQFASKANVAGPWLERHLEGAVAATSKARDLLAPSIRLARS